MSYNAKILADSISKDGVRLSTLEVTFPRVILPEFNTHRVFSRNSCSSRAIPISKIIEMVRNNPYIPYHWGKNQSGMQAHEEIADELKPIAIAEWLKERDRAVEAALRFESIGVHKQITNRLLEPFMWQTVIVSSTEWDNFFKQRRSPDGPFSPNHPAAPDIQRISWLIKEALDNSCPVKKDYGEWHLPLLPDVQEIIKHYDKNDYGYMQDILKKISTGRCARVSYLTHAGKRDLKADIELHDRMLASGHWSPFEHIARPLDHGETDKFPGDVFVGNFRGWVQYRKEFPQESGINIKDI